MQNKLSGCRFKVNSRLMRKNNIRDTEFFGHLPSQLFSISWLLSVNAQWPKQLSLSHRVLVQVHVGDTIANNQMICIKLK